MLGEPEDEVPVVPRAFRELSRTGRPQRMLERIITQRRAQSLHIGMSSDIHDLHYQPMPVPKSVFRGLPPDVLAGEGEQVHDAILHGRRPAIRIGKPSDTCASKTARIQGGLDLPDQRSRALGSLQWNWFRRGGLCCSCSRGAGPSQMILGELGAATNRHRHRVREEVQMEGPVRNVGAFARFLEAMSFAHGLVLNLAAVARDSHSLRPPETLARALNLAPDHAVRGMIVDQPHCLHEGICRRGPNEFPAELFQIL